MAKTKKKGRDARVALNSDSNIELMAKSKLEGQNDRVTLNSDSDTVTGLLAKSKKKIQNASLPLLTLNTDSDPKTELIEKSKKKGGDVDHYSDSDPETELTEKSKKKRRDAKVTLKSDSDTETETELMENLFSLPLLTLNKDSDPKTQLIEKSKKKGGDVDHYSESDPETELKEKSKKKRQDAKTELMEKLKKKRRDARHYSDSDTEMEVTAKSKKKRRRAEITSNSDSDTETELMEKLKRKRWDARHYLDSDTDTEVIAKSKKKRRDTKVTSISDSDTETELIKKSKKKGRDARHYSDSDSDTEMELMAKSKKKRQNARLTSNSKLKEKSKKKRQHATLASNSDSDTDIELMKKLKKKARNARHYSESDTDTEIEFIRKSKKKGRDATVSLNSVSDTESDSDHESARGRTVLASVRKAIENGEKIPLEWNAAKVPCGKHRTTFGTYVGVIARERVNINYEEWTHVPSELVGEVYNEIAKGFIVLPERRGWIVSRAAERWRAFKSRLARSYVYKRSGNIRKKAPLKYPFITQKDWEKFTAYCTSDKFKEKSEKNRARANMKTTRYRGGRKGYQHFENEIAKEFETQGIHIEKVPRHLSWLKAHENKADKSYAPCDLEIAEAIKTLDAQAKKGEISATGRDDILAKVLKKPENGGSVRGVGSCISNKEYFGPAERPKVGQMLEQIQALQSQVTKMATMQQFMMSYLMTCNPPSSMQFLPEQMKQFMASGFGAFDQSSGDMSQSGGAGGQFSGSAGQWSAFSQFNPFGGGGMFAGNGQNVPETFVSSGPLAIVHREPKTGHAP